MDFSTPDVPFYKSHISEIIAVIVIIIGALTLMALLNINLNEETKSLTSNHQDPCSREPH